MDNARYNSIVSDIETVTQAEKITKQGLAHLSRECLSYLVDTLDVRPINKLLGTIDSGKHRLSPMHYRLAAKYFNEFVGVGFTSNHGEVRKCITKGDDWKGQALCFKAIKNKLQGDQVRTKWEDCAIGIREWLDNPTNDIWTWSATQKMETKGKDYLNEFTKAAHILVNGQEAKGNKKAVAPIGLRTALQALLAVEGITAEAMLDALAGAPVAQVDEEA